MAIPREQPRVRTLPAPLQRLNVGGEWEAESALAGLLQFDLCEEPQPAQLDGAFNQQSALDLDFLLAERRRGDCGRFVQFGVTE